MDCPNVKECACPKKTCPNRVFTQSQIFEAVWSTESNSCHSSVVM